MDKLSEDLMVTYCDSCEGGVLPTLRGAVKRESGVLLLLCHQPARRSQESQLRYQPLRVISETEIFFQLCKPWI